MICLVEVTVTDKETQAIYTNYTSENDVLSELETKWGQAQDSDDVKATFLLAFDNTGKIIGSAYYNEDGTSIDSTRLIWITSDVEGEHPNMQKYDTHLKAEAQYHKKRGAAMKSDSGVMAILTMILDGASVGMNEYWVWTPPVIEPEEPAEEQG